SAKTSRSPEGFLSDLAGSTEAGRNNGTTTQTRNTHTSDTATIVPMPPTAIMKRAKRSDNATVHRVTRRRWRPVNCSERTMEQNKIRNDEIRMAKELTKS